MHERSPRKRSRPTVEAEEYLLAAKTANLDIIQRYLAENVDNIEALNVRNHEGDTAAMLTAQHGHTDMTAELLAAGCRVDRRHQIADNASSDGDEKMARIINDSQIRLTFVRRLLDERMLTLSRNDIKTS